MQIVKNNIADEKDWMWFLEEYRVCPNETEISNDFLSDFKKQRGNVQKVSLFNRFYLFRKAEHIGSSW